MRFTCNLEATNCSAYCRNTLVAYELFFKQCLTIPKKKYVNLQMWMLFLSWRLPRTGVTWAIDSKELLWTVSSVLENKTNEHELFSLEKYRQLFLWSGSLKYLIPESKQTLKLSKDFGFTTLGLNCEKDFFFYETGKLAGPKQPCML